MTSTSNAFRISLTIYAKDKHKLAAFYSQALDLVKIEEEEDFVVLEAGDVEVVVVRIPEHIAAQIEIAVPPDIREDTPIKPVFFVRSLAVVRQMAEATGGRLKPADSAWRFRGATVLDGCDPEGNVLQFRQIVS